MAEIELTDEQQRQILSFTMALGQDAALRDRFQADPHAVLDEHGLSMLLPGEVQFEIATAAGEVGGFLLATPGSHIDQHIDWAHYDTIVNYPTPVRYLIAPKTTRGG
jgi:hypothetical protein